MNTVFLPKGVQVPVCFGPEGYDETATTAAVMAVIEKFRLELENDQTVVLDLINTIRLEHGADGVPVSAMPTGPLYADLHGRLGSLAKDADKGLFARNEVKIDAVLADISIGGQGGTKFVSAEEITARRDVKAAKKRIRDARKAEEKKVLAAYRASKAV